jgi:CubicO group peptidase (beta-lactamase class C family)
MKKYLIILTACFINYANAQSIPQKIDELIQAYAKENKFNGTVLVVQKGKVLFEKGYGYRDVEKRLPNDGNTIFQLASISKQFTATAILKLVELNKMALTDKLSKFYPGYPKGDSITVENLLTHTAGVYDFTREESGQKITTLMQMIDRFKNKPLDFPPGKGWRYSNSNYTLLAYIIGKVSGMTYEKAVRKYIFEPLQMTRSGFDFLNLADENKATGYSVLNDNTQKAAIIGDSVGIAGCGSIYSTAADLYKWHNGLQQYKIVGRKLMERAYAPFSSNYGYGWMIDSLYGKRTVSHGGDIAGFTTNISRITADDVCIVLLNNTENVNMQLVSRKILAILYNQPYRLTVLRSEKKEVTLPVASLQRYVGTYKDPYSSRVLIISVGDGKLQLQPAKQAPKFTLLAQSEGYFFVSPKIGSFEIEFKDDEMLFIDMGTVNVAKKVKN